MLRDENNLYELMGYDYVLDLLAEMEVPRGFPYTLAPFLVTTDHSKDGPHGQQKMQDRSDIKHVKRKSHLPN